MVQYGEFAEGRLAGGVDPRLFTGGELLGRDVFLAESVNVADEGVGGEGFEPIGFSERGGDLIARGEDGVVAREGARGEHAADPIFGGAAVQQCVTGVAAVECVEFVGEAH